LAREYEVAQGPAEAPIWKTIGDGQAVQCGQQQKQPDEPQLPFPPESSH